MKATVAPDFEKIDRKLSRLAQDERKLQSDVRAQTQTVAETKRSWSEDPVSFRESAIHAGRIRRHPGPTKRVARRRKYRAILTVWVWRFCVWGLNRGHNLAQVYRWTVDLTRWCIGLPRRAYHVSLLSYRRVCNLIAGTEENELSHEPPIDPEFTDIDDDSGGSSNSSDGTGIDPLG